MTETPKIVKQSDAPKRKLTTATITEGMAELKLFVDKIAKKVDFIRKHSITYSNQPDPLKATGGRAKSIKEYKQAINDLAHNYETIRLEIMKANIKETITIQGETKTIYEWLVWRKETYTTQLNVAKIYEGVESVQRDLATRPKLFKPEGWKEGEAQTVLIAKSNISIMDYRKEEEKWGDIFNKLDGKLSKKNATVKITY